MALPKKIVRQAAKEFGLTCGQVTLLYNQWWYEARLHISSLDMGKDLSRKQTNINIAHFGKLVLSETMVKKFQENAVHKDKTDT